MPASQFVHFEVGRRVTQFRPAPCILGWQAEQSMGMAGGGNMARLRHIYSVFVDDNYDLPPDDGRYKLGDFATLDEAVAACKRMGDEVFKGHVSLYKNRRT